MHIIIPRQHRHRSIGSPILFHPYESEIAELSERSEHSLLARGFIGTYIGNLVARTSNRLTIDSRQSEDVSWSCKGHFSLGSCPCEEVELDLQSPRGSP